MWCSALVSDSCLFCFSVPLNRACGCSDRWCYKRLKTRHSLPSRLIAQDRPRKPGDEVTTMTREEEKLWLVPLEGKSSGGQGDWECLLYPFVQGASWGRDSSRSEGLSQLKQFTAFSIGAAPLFLVPGANRDVAEMGELVSSCCHPGAGTQWPLR